MNLSGSSVAAAARFFKSQPESIVAVHDEVDLEPGRLQLRLGGGLAGHNGLRSLKQSLGSADFLRVRAGVGRPGRGDRRPVADYVLSPFEPDEDRRGARRSRRRRRRGARPRGPRPGAGAVQLGLRATAIPACQPGARPPAGGCSDSGASPLRASSHATIEFEFHISPAASSSRPHTSAGTCGARPSTRSATAGSSVEAPRAVDRLVAIGDVAVAPAPHLVAEDPEATRPAGADRAARDDAALAGRATGNRRLLDHVAPHSDAHLERGVVEVARLPPREACPDRLEGAAAQPDAVAARTERQPVEIDAGPGLGVVTHWRLQRPARGRGSPRDGR